jgi:hypothetical protein
VLSHVEQADQAAPRAVRSVHGPADRQGSYVPFHVSSRNQCPGASVATDYR